MARAKRCPICLASPDVLSRVNALLESGIKLAVICSEVGAFNVFQLSRHKNKCIIKPLNGNAADDLEAAVWLERLHQAHQQAVIDGNLPAQISACTAAARTLEKIRKAEAEKRDAELPDNVNKWTEEQGAQFRHYIDSVVREATANAKPGDAIDDYAWLIALSTETRLLLRKVTGNPGLLAQTRELVAHQIPQCPITTGETNAPAN
jgi:hypothetical protein